MKAAVVMGLAGLGLATFWGCQREEMALPNSGQAGEVNVTPRVQAFIADAAHHSSNRDGGLITTDSAEWYIEAALNLSYTDIAKEYEDQEVDSVYLSIPMVDGQVQEVAAGEAFNALGQIVNAANLPEVSHVAIVDVVSSIGPNGLDLLAVYVVGSGYDRGVPNTTYGPTDFWEFGINPSSYCGCNGNTGYGKCADKQIQQRINFAINGGYYMYWTNVESWFVEPLYTTDLANHIIGLVDYPMPISTDNPVLGDGIHDYPVYYETGLCMDPSDMTFYTQGTWDLMQTIRATYVSSKQSASATVTAEMTVCTGCDAKFHRVTYRYGKLSKSH